MPRPDSAGTCRLATESERLPRGQASLTPAVGREWMGSGCACCDWQFATAAAEHREPRAALKRALEGLGWVGPACMCVHEKMCESAGSTVVSASYAACRLRYCLNRHDSLNV